jgi:hypothetical protein
MTDSTIDGWQLLDDAKTRLQPSEVVESAAITPFPRAALTSTANSISNGEAHQPQLTANTSHRGPSYNRGSQQQRLNTAESAVVQDEERLDRILPSVQNGQREPRIGIGERIGQAIFLAAMRKLWLPKRH